MFLNIQLFIFTLVITFEYTLNLKINEPNGIFNRNKQFIHNLTSGIHISN